MGKKSIFLIITFALIFVANVLSQGWTIQNSPTTQNLYAVSNSNANTWVAVGGSALGGSGTIIRSSDGGINWSQITSPVADALRGVSLRGSIGLAVGISGRMVRTTDAGLSWVEIPRQTTRNLYCVSISDVFTVAMGHEGTILVSYDNGLTWAARGAGTASILFGVSAYSTTGVGVGGAGAVVMSPNSGSGWGLTVIGSQLTFFYGTSFVNTLTGWLVGSTTPPQGNVIARSNNGGFVWTGQTAPTTEQLFGVSFAALDTGTAVGGNGAIIHTSSGGNTWVNQTSGTTQILNGVSFWNTSLGIAVGNSGTILRTTTGGVTGVSHENNSVPTGFGLSQNYPNPFNPSTNIKFSIPYESNVKLTICNILGETVSEPLNENIKPGNYVYNWDGTGFSSGVYFYTLITSSFSETKRMLLVK